MSLRAGRPWPCAAEASRSSGGKSKGGASQHLEGGGEKGACQKKFPPAKEEKNAREYLGGRRRCHSFSYDEGSRSFSSFPPNRTRLWALNLITVATVTAPFTQWHGLSGSGTIWHVLRKLVQ